jgi:hypothetical protein
MSWVSSWFPFRSGYNDVVAGGGLQAPGVRGLRYMRSGARGLSTADLVPIMSLRRACLSRRPAQASQPPPTPDASSDVLPK